MKHGTVSDKENNRPEASLTQAAVETRPASAMTRVIGALKESETPRNLTLGALSILAFLFLWQVLGMIGLLNVKLVPPPTEVVLEAGRMMQSGMLPSDVYASVRRALLGFGIGASLGIVIGLFTGRISFVKHSLEPLIQLLRPIPSIAWVPLAILWFGLGEASKLFLISYGVFFPVWLNTHIGVTSVDVNYIRAALCLGAQERRLFREIILPASLPLIAAGLRQGIAVAFIVLVAAELTGASGGVGFRIEESHMVFRADRMLVGLATLGIMGAIADRGFARIISRLLFWV